jgi:oligosaccharide repeat unit polymerase
LSSILPAIVSGIAFLVALRIFPMLHPVQIWTGSWAIATVLYALRLLPYRDLSWLTAGLICGAVVVFAAGALLGAQLAGRRPVSRSMRAEARSIEVAAWLAIGLLGVTFAAFIAQLVSRYGVARVLRVSPEVKLYLAGGEAPLSGTYVDVAIAATAICALAGGLAEAKSRRRWWLFAAAACGASVYFSTSRAFIAVALTAGLAALLYSGIKLDRRKLTATVLAAGVIGVTIFIGLGSVLGKTYGNSSIGQFDNFFSRHPSVTWLALPYQDTTAGIPALDLLAGVSTTWGTAHGCATAPIPCGILRKLGVPAERVPVAGPFTSIPLQWNGYTFLDRFLIDGGTALSLVLVAITGLIAGYLWARARAGSAVSILVYAASVPSLVLAYRQNLIATVAVAAVIAIALLLLARPLARHWAASRRSDGLLA